MDYLCAKFGDFSSFWFYCVDKQTETRTETDRITDVAKRFTPVTVVGL